MPRVSLLLLVEDEAMPIHSFVLFLPLVALWGWLPGLTPTLKMFAVSLSMFCFIKLHSLMLYQVNTDRQPSWFEKFVWFFGWAGLDPNAFFKSEQAVQGRESERGRVTGWLHEAFEAISKMAIGFALLVLVAPRLISVSPLLAGWVGMAGIVVVFHCGLIHLSAIGWNIIGRPVKPIMNSPLLATTVSEFWSKRWNLAFRDYAHVCIFKPLARKTNGTTAAFAGFLFSGIIHDLAISVPAGGGYGWPTLYFILQAVALLSERYLKKSGYVLSNRLTGHIWTALWIAGPAFILLHQPFVLNVIVPIVEWLGARWLMLFSF